MIIMSSDVSDLKISSNPYISLHRLFILSNSCRTYECPSDMREKILAEIYTNVKLGVNPVESMLEQFEEYTATPWLEYHRQMSELAFQTR